MRQTGQEVRVPFNKGFYGGPTDTYSTLTTHNFIPLGYYHGADVVNDDCGYLRARPSLGYHVTYASNTGNPLACFKFGSRYFVVTAAEGIQRYNSGWAAIANTPTTYTGRVNVDYVTEPSSTATSAIVSEGVNDSAGAYIEAGTDNGCTLYTGNAKGICAHDEGRLFAYNTGGFYYSTRFVHKSGYNDTAGGEWFYLPEVCDKVVMMRNIAGSLYVIQSQESAHRIYIWKKVGNYADSAELLDHTIFQQIFGVDDACIRNGNDGVAALGGSICFWAYGSGLNIVTDRGSEVVSEPIQAWNPHGLDVDCIVASDQRSKYIFCKETNSTTTLAYNVATKTWSKWNINVTCKGYGQAGGIFGVSGTWSPAYVSAYATDNVTDTTIVPTFYTPVLDMGQPHHEKFLTQIHASARGVSSITPHYRLTPDDSFTTGDAIASPEQITRLSGDLRFGEIFFKIVGTPTFYMKEFKLVYDLGDTIYE